MRNIWLVTKYTFREALSRRVFIAFGIIATLGIIITALILSNLSLPDLFPEEAGIEQESMGFIAAKLQEMIIGFLGGLGLILAIFSTSSFIPALLEKGTIDIFLSKPMSRAQLLAGRFAGGILMVLASMTYLVGGIWLVISFVFNAWHFEFLYSIFTITWTFAVLYALIVFMGVITHSSMLGMMSAYFIFFIVSPILSAHESLSEFLGQGAVIFLLEVLYYIVPNTSDLLGEVTSTLVAGEGIAHWEPILTSLLFTVIIFGFSLVIFEKKDF